MNLQFVVQKKIKQSYSKNYTSVPPKEYTFQKYPIEIYSYLAGFLDGEGHLIAYKSNSINKPLSVLIGATNTKIEPLELFKEVFGGRINGRQRNPKHKFVYE